MIRDLSRSPLTRSVVLWHVLWGLVALLTDAKFLIEILNGLVLAVAAGVVVTYSSSVVHACRKAHPSDSDILVVGIWLAWVSLIEARIWSVTWRMLGMPSWFQNTDFTTHIIALGLLAGLFHLAGPEAIDGRVPTREWVKIGIIVACGGVLAVALIMIFGDSGGLIRGR